VTDGGFEITWECAQTPCVTTLLPCNEVASIFALPFIESNSTCDAGDDVQTGPCGEDILMGEDFIYTYMPSMNGCLDIQVTGINLNTGLSIYNGCPESATACLAQLQNTTEDNLSINVLEVNAFNPIFIVLSNALCTDFSITVEQVDCPETVGASGFCGDAFLLNRCNDFPEIYEVSQQTTPIDAYFQENINDGCWDGLGAGHLTWLFFQAQTDGEFGFLAQNIDDNELANIDIQVWGPIENLDEICIFMANNQPVRSTGAAGNSSTGIPDLTGLVNTNPLDETAVMDECEATDGDGFISTLPVTDQGIYLVLINDFSGNVTANGLSLDFSPTTVGVLDGLTNGTELSSPEYVITGDAFHTSINQDYSCIQMSAAQNSQLSCAWSPEPIDFSQPFTNTVTMYFGSDDEGADGICMVYQQSSDGLSACGVLGGQIGAGTIENSLIIEFDTWQNPEFADPFQDHIAANVNGDMTAPIAGPIIQPNLENGQEYEVAFTWNPTTTTFQIFMNGTLQMTGVYDLINDAFGGSNTAFGGYTASTGGASNLQYVCTGQNIYPGNKLDSITVLLCEGDSYFAEGMEQTTSGIYTDSFNTFSGCDSTIVTDLTIQMSTSDTVEVAVCLGESIFVGGANQNTAGIYVDTLASTAGCDSLVFTDLSFLPSDFIPINIELCEGESIFVGGALQTTSGTYIDTLTSINGCDSLVFSELNFNEKFDAETTVLICAGDAYFVGGAAQTVAGFYLDTLQSIGGCDSIVTTDLSIFEATLMVLTPDDLSCETPCITLDATGSDEGENINYQWIGPLPNEIRAGDSLITFMACEPGTYSFQLTNTFDELNCLESIDVSVNFDESISCGYNIPNAFTPNGDGNNDIFGLVDEGSSNTVRSLTIYNRWGKEVHNGKGETHTWDGEFDGKPAAADVYIYIFEVEVVTGEVIIEKGDVTLIR
jgi:gliding motility-associated-like protein